MKYAVEMGSYVMMYILNLIKTDSDIQKSVVEIHRNTVSMEIAKSTSIIGCYRGELSSAKVNPTYLPLLTSTAFIRN
jgi:hypothetical protein